MKERASRTLKAITRGEGTVGGEALVSTKNLSRLFNAIGSDGVIRMNAHPLMGQIYPDRIMVYDTDICSTGGTGTLFQEQDHLQRIQGMMVTPCTISAN